MTYRRTYILKNRIELKYIWYILIDFDTLILNLKLFLNFIRTVILFYCGATLKTFIKNAFKINKP